MSDMTVGRSILGRKENFKTMRVPIPEWEGDVILRQISHRKLVEIQTLATEAVDVSKLAIKDKAKLSRFGILLIAYSWVDDAGDPILKTEEDYELLNDEPDSVCSQLVQAIRDFNNMDEGAQANAKKNSSPSQNGASGTS